MKLQIECLVLIFSTSSCEYKWVFVEQHSYFYSPSLLNMWQPMIQIIFTRKSEMQLCKTFALSLFSTRCTSQAPGAPPKSVASLCNHAGLWTCMTNLMCASVVCIRTQQRSTVDTVCWKNGTVNSHVAAIIRGHVIPALRTQLCIICRNTLHNYAW